MDEFKQAKKITILQAKQNTKHINKVFVNLFEDNINQEKVSIEINFIEISEIIGQTQNKKFSEKGLGKCIEIDPKDIIIVGVKNKH